MLQDVVDQMHVQLQEHAPEAVESALMVQNCLPDKRIYFTGVCKELQLIVLPAVVC